MSPKQFSFGDKVVNDLSKTNRWLTPSWIVESLGEFDLDPCGAPNHDLAKQTFIPERNEDGLKLPWHGRVWVNPPYGREAVPFMQKIAEHGDGILFVFARTDTRAFHEYVFGMADAALFLRGRVRFLKDDDSKTKDANAPSVLVAYGDKNVKALESCGIDGKFVRF